MGLQIDKILGQMVDFLLKRSLTGLSITELNFKGIDGSRFLGFDVQKHGESRIAMIGFPSVGKSSLLNLVTE